MLIPTAVRNRLVFVFLLTAVILLGLSGCNDGEGLLRAKLVEREDELIGGPMGKGKIGDFILENDKIKAIVAGPGATWTAGIFGGTLIDLDLRRSHAEFAYREARSSFGETFPTMNLIIADPVSDLRQVLPGGDGEGFELELKESSIRVLEDGSNGERAVVRVEGAGGYIFDVLKYLNRNFLLSFVDEPLDLAALIPEEFEGALGLLGVEEAYIPAAAAAIPEVLGLLGPVLGLTGDQIAALDGANIHLYRLLERLAIDFDFQTDYIVKPGDRFITIRTTVKIAPPSAEALSERCPPLSCELDCGPDGYVMQEVLSDCDPPERCKLPLRTAGIPGTQDAIFCPICECAEEHSLPVLTETRSIFNDIIGSGIDNWTDPLWRSGLVAGDFLFFGSECNIFAPGVGYDENRKIFENMWQGVGTVANPLSFPWVGGVAGKAGVSYAAVTTNPHKRDGERWADCPSYRYALVWLDPEAEAELLDILLEEYPERGTGQVRAALRGLALDRTELALEPFATADIGDLSSFEAFRAEALAAPRAVELEALFGDYAEIDIIPQTDCRPARLLVPLFTTSATVVMTHAGMAGQEVGGEIVPGLEEGEDGVIVDRGRVFSYERHIAVGKGDIGSLLDTVLDLRGESYGFIEGVVVENGTGRPLSNIDVFAVRDPRPVMAELPEKRARRLPDVPGDLRQWDYDLLLAVNREVFGDLGFVSQMQTDRGVNPVRDGTYSGALPPGDYILVAKGADHAPSRLTAVTISAGRTGVAHLALEQTSTVSYRIVDASGALVPARLTFVALDDEGRPLSWDGRLRPELGDTRNDYGIQEVVLGAYGAGEVKVEPGRYRVYASRGLEYDIDHKDVELKPGRDLALEFQLFRSVDTSGWLSGDFHLHARPSVDSALLMEDRVMSNVVEGLEMVVSADHDTITDYRPAMNELGLYPWIGFQAGVETSSLEFGHFNIWPLDYDDRLGEVKDPPPWRFRRTGEVFDGMRARGLGGPDGTVIQVNHPRDGFMGYFAQMGLNGYDLNRATPGLEACNPVSVEISCDFDAVEVLNEKRFELVRTPTAVEVARYNDCNSEMVEARYLSDFRDGSMCEELVAGPSYCPPAEIPEPGAVPDEERHRLIIERNHCDWHQEFRDELNRCQEVDELLACKRIAFEALKLLMVRYMLERTPEEQAALAFFREHPEFAPGCDADLAMAGCEPRRDENNGYLPGCGGDDGSECACFACVCGTPDLPGIMPECCLPPPAEGAPEPTEGELVGTGWTVECAAACRHDCHACEASPCSDRFQMLDDWMTFLNQGFNVTALGNSDSHDLKFEAGLPRNWIRVKNDNPANIDIREFNASILEHRAITSSGPFVEFELNGHEVGAMVELGPDEEVVARIRVQTPRWFGIDRVEIYRNGRMERLIMVDSTPENVVVLDETFSLGRPATDSWYAVIAYGLNADSRLDPVYNGIPYGKILLPTVLMLAMEAVLSPFEDLLEPFSAFLDISALLGGSELPDSFPTLPFALTNPIWVDVDGGGFDPPQGRDATGDGQWDLPAFCSQPCDLVRDGDGAVVEARSTCGVGQVCMDDGSGAGVCGIPINPECFDGHWANDLSVRRAPLSVEEERETTSSGLGVRRALQSPRLLQSAIERKLESHFEVERGVRRRMPARPVD